MRARPCGGSRNENAREALIFAPVKCNIHVRSPSSDEAKGMFVSFRSMKLLIAAMALLAFAAAADLCLHGDCALDLPAPLAAGEAPLAATAEAAPGAAEAAAPAAACWRADACGEDCPAPAGAHAEHCAFCPCFCHVAGILPLFDAGAPSASAPGPLAEPIVQAASDFPAGLDRPPIAA